MILRINEKTENTLNELKELLRLDGIVMTNTAIIEMALNCEIEKIKYQKSKLDRRQNKLDF